MGVVEIASLAMGLVTDTQGNAQPSATVTITNLDGSAATHYADTARSSPLTSALTTNADGTIPRFIETGIYNLTAGGTTRQLHAIPGSVVPVDAGLSTAASAAANGATLLTAVTRAAGRPVYIPTGDYPCAATFTDADVWLTGPGRLIQPQGSPAITVTRTLGASKAVTVTTVKLGQDGATDESTELATKITVTGGVTGIAAGDIFHLISQDAYAWPSGTGNAYRAGIVNVHGLGLTAAGITGGGFAAGQTVTGASSGATGVLASVVDQGTTRELIFAAITGTFTNGENLQVSGTTRGTASGTAYVLVAGTLIDDYTTSPVMRLMTQAKFRIDGGLRIAASGDVDAVVGAANREPAIVLKGVIGANIDIDIDSAWTRAVQLTGCYRCDVNARVWHLPNDDSDNAYGYGVEVFGATEKCAVRVTARRVRHAFTTNIDTNSTFASVVPIRAGVPKHNIISGIADGPLATGFDTHNGAYYTQFKDCTVIDTLGAGRAVSGISGFQDRSFGTSYEDCVAINCSVGFVSLANQLASPIPHRTLYKGCRADNYRAAGFDIPGASIDAQPRVEYVDCEATGDGRAVNDPYYQAGFQTHTCTVLYDHCRSRKFNGAPFRVVAGSGRVTWNDCLTDYTECPSGVGTVAGIRFDAAPGEANLLAYKVRLHASVPTNVVSLIRVAGGAVTVNTDGPRVVNGTRPLSDVTAGSLAVNVVPGAAYGSREVKQAGIIAPTSWVAGTAARGLAANRAFIVRVVPSRDIVVALIAFTVQTAATADDACDVGIYDAAMARLVSSGATTGKLNSTGVKTVAVTATKLNVDTVYYVAMSCGTLGGTAATVNGAAYFDNFGAIIFGTGNGVFEAAVQDTAHPLPSTFVPVTGTFSTYPRMALRES
jgi:hypothetical protein